VALDGKGGPLPQGPALDTKVAQLTTILEKFEFAVDATDLSAPDADCFFRAFSLTYCGDDYASDTRKIMVFHSLIHPTSCQPWVARITNTNPAPLKYSALVSAYLEETTWADSLAVHLTALAFHVNIRIIIAGSSSYYMISPFTDPDTRVISLLYFQNRHYAAVMNGPY
jgi:hypothetical protein